MGNCIDGKEHEVITASDDRDRWDPEVLGQFGPPAVAAVATWQWGYCVDCRQGFRWSVNDQQWRPWPSGLAQLPYLDDEELDHLHGAILHRRRDLEKVLGLAEAEGTKVEVGHMVQILWGLDTAVQESRYGLFPREGPHEPRAWGEAWDVLLAWVQEQLAGIQRSSPNASTDAAFTAFLAVVGKIEALKGQPDCLVAEPGNDPDS